MSNLSENFTWDEFLQLPIPEIQEVLDAPSWIEKSPVELVRRNAIKLRFRELLNPENENKFKNMLNERGLTEQQKSKLQNDFHRERLLKDQDKTLGFTMKGLSGNDTPPPPPGPPGS